MRRIYKDWTIEVTKINHATWGDGYRAEFWIAKANGLKACFRTYDVYDTKLKPIGVEEQVEKILNALYY